MYPCCVLIGIYVNMYKVIIHLVHVHEGLKSPETAVQGLHLLSFDTARVILCIYMYVLGV